MTCRSKVYRAYRMLGEASRRMLAPDTTAGVARMVEIAKHVTPLDVSQGLGNHAMWENEPWRIGNEWQGGQIGGTHRPVWPGEIQGTVIIEMAYVLSRQFKNPGKYISFSKCICVPTWVHTCDTVLPRSTEPKLQSPSLRATQALANTVSTREKQRLLWSPRIFPHNSSWDHKEWPLFQWPALASHTPGPGVGPNIHKGQRVCCLTHKVCVDTRCNY